MILSSKAQMKYTYIYYITRQCNLAHASIGLTLNTVVLVKAMLST